MIKSNGVLVGARYCSNIYFIIHNGYLYIGETGGHPSIRWGGHLSKGGTLRENLRRFEQDDINECEEIFFASIATNIIDYEDELNRKIARKAVEYEVQRHFFLNTCVFGEELRVVSTVSSNPVRYRFGFDPDSFSQAILKMAVEKYKKWKIMLECGDL
ncbi:hypothetical protein IG605_007210 [Pectobacterium quasiaquaticum]|uniref:Uncharacterized protein n=1 Tax=Pectobacterium quasiaquaticum TaxID=2774015 RepID=A0A9Q2EUF1_9GAMM|nr:hypothetical protein [Pectobacterium quasiaquaticum]MBE5204383.1 hypothetical protein [Pectobacterium quasiaquaticum]MBE5210585.1 hypothetical protein [Pectobacterium quasiaquaticum]MBE5223562.1 hypothetical protein [Pectobacterium quasiaquaticum]URG50284.1 hypothetical protein IG609_007190 [Pectobacterium quasiaquaticum]URG54061.1 hypothetical protein IG605_007210 [Pectobacterium quasiaquaticum]